MLSLSCIMCCFSFVSKVKVKKSGSGVILYWEKYIFLKPECPPVYKSGDNRACLLGLWGMDEVFHLKHSVECQI